MLDDLAGVFNKGWTQQTAAWFTTIKEFDYQSFNPALTLHILLKLHKMKMAQVAKDKADKVAVTDFPLGSKVFKRDKPFLKDMVMCIGLFILIETSWLKVKDKSKEKMVDIMSCIYTMYRIESKKTQKEVLKLTNMSITLSRIVAALPLLTYILWDIGVCRPLSAPARYFSL